jgi:hypothetical protein
MTISHKDTKLKCDRALELHEQGLETDVIGERLGIVRRGQVSAAIKEGRKRREKSKKESQ